MGDPGPAVLRYTIQAKNARGKALSLIIDQALSDPDLFVFSELIEVPSVQTLRGTSEAPHLNALEIFAYGTHHDYLDTSGLPPLKSAQERKLRMLTIVSLAHTKKTLPYSELLSAVSVGTIRELEDLVIDAIYAGLLAGKLDQRRQQLSVDWAAGRDLRPDDLDRMIALFEGWADNCGRLLEQLDREVADANAAKAQDAERERRVLAEIEQIKALQAAEGDKKDGKTPSSSEFSSAEFADEHRRSQGRMGAQ